MFFIKKFNLKDDFFQNSTQRAAALRSGGIFTTAFDTKNRTQIYAKSVRRSTEARLTQNRC
jgi:hypothetical protein